MPEELLIAGSIRCPSCGAVQPDDRPVCLECGMHFSAKIQILAARRPLGLPPVMLGVLGVAGLFLLVASVSMSRKPPPLVVPEGVDIFSPPPPPAPVVPAPVPAPATHVETPKPVEPVLPVPAPAPVPPPRPVLTTPPLPPVVGTPPPVPAETHEPEPPAVDPAVLAEKQRALQQEVVREWERARPMFEVGAYASLSLAAGGVAEGQVSMIGEDNVLISFASERKRVAFNDLAPESRLRVDVAYRRGRIVEEVMKRMSGAPSDGLKAP